MPPGSTFRQTYEADARSSGRRHDPPYGRTADVYFSHSDEGGAPVGPFQFEGDGEVVDAGPGLGPVLTGGEHELLSTWRRA